MKKSEIFCQQPTACSQPLKIGKIKNYSMRNESIFGIKNKKGSHMEMVMSFTIFIVALIFAYTIVDNPLKAGFNKEDSVVLLEDKIIDEISRDVIIVWVSSNESVPANLVFETPNISLFDNPELVAVDSNGDRLPSSFGVGDSTVSIDSSGFVKAYYTDSSFNTAPMALEGWSLVPKDVKSKTLEKRIFEKEMIEIINKSIENETGTRRDLEISLSNEFSIAFDYLNVTIIGSLGKEIKGNIYAKESYINYLSVDGEEKIGRLIVKIW